MGDFEIEPQVLEQFIRAGLAEDVGEGDHTSLACISPLSMSKGQLLVKQGGVIAGVDLARRIFRTVDADAEFNILIGDGVEVVPGDIVFTVSCRSWALLQAERLVLNCMQRMSGIATHSRLFISAMEGLPTTILDTRKTTPLIRFLEKWAVAIGGCSNYRSGLFDWIMIKDNHIDACGSVSKAIIRVQEYLKTQGLDLGITVEVRNFDELEEVLQCGQVTRIMLDNFEVDDLKKAVKKISGRFQSEASGGISLQSVRSYAETGVDYISVGSLTHSAGVLDLSLKIVK